jgi:phosphoserine phosphatase
LPSDARVDARQTQHPRNATAAHATLGAMDAAVYERVLAVAQRLASSSDLDDVLGAIIDALRDLLNAERASVFQYIPPSSATTPSDGAAPTTASLAPDHSAATEAPAARDATTASARGAFFATKAHGLPGDLTLPADVGLLGDAARTREIVNVPDARRDPRFNPNVDRQTGFATRAVLTIPLLDERGELVGVAQALNKRATAAPTHASTTFTTQDEALARHLAAQAGVALRRAHLFEDARRREALEAEVRAARVIQRASVPGGGDAVITIDTPGWRIAGGWRPASETAGDVWDVVPRQPPGAGTVLLLADAAGHGVGPALSVSRVSAMVRGAVRANLALVDIAAIVNHQLVDDLPAGLFVTAFLAELRPPNAIGDAGDEATPATHRLTYIAAGQAPILLWNRAVNTITQHHASAPPLGVTRWTADSPTLRTLDLQPDDALLVISDGVLEAGAQQAGSLTGALGVDAVHRAIDPGQPIERAVAAAIDLAAPLATDDRTALAVQPRPAP